MDNFCIRLKKLRQERGLSQGELGSELNIPRTTLSAWEQGVRQADASSLNLLCDFFNVSADYLLGRIDVRNPIDEYNLNNELSSLFGHLPEIESFIKKITVRKQLQLFCIRIEDLSDDILLKLSKITEILDESK